MTTDMQDRYSVLVLKQHTAAERFEARAEALRALLGGSLADAEQALRGAPAVVRKDLLRDEARELLESLRAEGFEARMIAATRSRRVTVTSTATDDEPDLRRAAHTSGGYLVVPSETREQPLAATPSAGVAGAAVRRTRRSSGESASVPATPSVLAPSPPTDPPGSKIQPAAGWVDVPPLGPAPQSPAPRSPAPLSPTPPAVQPASGSTPLRAPSPGTPPARPGIAPEERASPSGPLAQPPSDEPDDDVFAWADEALRETGAGQKRRGSDASSADPSDPGASSPDTRSAPAQTAPMVRPSASDAPRVAPPPPRSAGPAEAPAESSPAPAPASLAPSVAPLPHASKPSRAPNALDAVLGNREGEGPGERSFLGDGALPTDGESAPARAHSIFDELAALDDDAPSPPGPSSLDFFGDFQNAPALDREAPGGEPASGATADGATADGNAADRNAADGDDGESPRRVGIPMDASVGVPISSIEDELAEVSGLHQLDLLEKAAARDASRAERRPTPRSTGMHAPVRTTGAHAALPDAPRRPPRRRVPWGTVGAIVALLVLVTAVGWMVRRQQEHSAPLWRLASAPLYLEVRYLDEPSAASMAGCATDAVGTVCRYDASWFLSRVPELTSEQAEALARTCFGERSADAAHERESVRCPIDPDAPETSDTFEWTTGRVCETPLDVMDPRTTTACRTRTSLRRSRADGSEVAGDAREGEWTWRFEAEHDAVDTPIGPVAAREFVVTATGERPRRVYWSPELGVSLQRSTIGPTTSGQPLQGVWHADYATTWLRTDDGTRGEGYFETGETLNVRLAPPSVDPEPAAEDEAADEAADEAPAGD